MRRLAIKVPAYPGGTWNLVEVTTDGKAGVNIRSAPTLELILVEAANAASGYGLYNGLMIPLVPA